jgi:hypothetical protein
MPMLSAAIPLRLREIVFDGSYSCLLKWAILPFSAIPGETVPGSEGRHRRQSIVFMPKIFKQSIIDYRGRR